MELGAIYNKTTLAKMFCRRKQNLAQLGFSYLSYLWIIECWLSLSGYDPKEEKIAGIQKPCLIKFWDGVLSSIMQR